MKRRILSFITAITILTSLAPTFTLTANAADAPINLGDYVQMGVYNGEDILWRCVAFEKVKEYKNGVPVIDSTDTVTEYKDGYLPLMLADTAVCNKEFDAAGSNTSGSHGRGSGRTYGSNYWGDSNIRDWLNSSALAEGVNWSCGNAPSYKDEAGFLANFNILETTAMKTVTQKTLLSYRDKDISGVTGSEKPMLGNNMGSVNISEIVGNYANAYSKQFTDTMFLLDAQQVKTVYDNYGDYYKLSGDYWLRLTNGENNMGEHVWAVNTSGGVTNTPGYSGWYGVRPAFFLNTTKANFVSGNGGKTTPYSFHKPLESAGAGTVHEEIAPDTQGLASINLGDYIELGGYNGENIKWRCVAFEKATRQADGTVLIDSISTQTTYSAVGSEKDSVGYLPLMLADTSICNKEFDAAGDVTTGSHDRSDTRKFDGSNYWGDSNLRDWLNSTDASVNWSCGNAPSYADEAGFLSSGNFNSQALKAITRNVKQKSLLHPCDQSKKDSASGTNVQKYSDNINNVVQNYTEGMYKYEQDSVFCLDVQQLKNVYDNYSNYYKLSGDYWLRSPDTDVDYEGSVRVVYSGGSVDSIRANFSNAYYGSLGVRPAFFLNLSSSSGSADGFIYSKGNGGANSPYTHKAHPGYIEPTAVSGTIYRAGNSPLIAAGAVTSEGCKMQYKVASVAANGAETIKSDWNEKVPRAISSLSEGNYKVYWRVVGGAGYFSEEANAQFLSVSIIKATPTITAPTAKELTYTGKAQALIDAGSAMGGEMQYSLSQNSSYSTNIPQGTDAKEYTVWYKVIGDRNHNNIEPQSVKVTIAKLTPTVTAPMAITGLSYTGAAQALITAGSTTGGTMQYSLSQNEGYSTAIPQGTDAKEYTVWYKAVGSGNYGDTEPQSVKVTIAKVTPTYTAPTAKDLTYSGSAQALVDAGGTTDGTIQYSLSESGDYSTNIPTGTDATEYTVWYKVIGDGNHTDAAAQSVKVTIAKAKPTLIQPTPEAVTYGAKLSDITLGDNWAWENGDTVPTVTNSGYTAKYTVSDYANYDWSSIQGYDNGTHKVTRTITVTVNKATPSVTAPKAKTGLYYSGAAQALIDAGSTTDGTIQYSLSENDGYSTDIPQGTAANTYTVWYKVVGDSNHTDAAAKSVKVTIKKANPTVTAPKAKDLTYSGSAQELIEAGSTTDGTIQYSLSESGDYSTNIPTGTDAKEYTVWYKVVGDGNHTDAAAKSVKVTIKKANPTVTVPTAKNLTYTGAAQALVDAGSTSDGTIQYSLSENDGYSADIPQGTDAKEYTVYYKVVGDSNHNNAEPQSVTVTIKKATPTLIQPTPEAVTYGAKLSDITLGDGWTWDNGDTIPTVTNSGYTAKYTVSDYSNYDWSKIQGYNNDTHKVTRTIAVTVNKANPIYTAPTNLTAVYGQTLADVTLPNAEKGTWTWNSASTSVGNVGNNSFTATFTPNDTANYNVIDDISVSVAVSAKAVTDSMILDISDQTYTGAEIKPTVTVKDGSTTLKENTDYTVSYSNNVNVGTATVTITGKGNYTVTAGKTFTINPKAVTDSMISDIDNQTYTGAAIEPTVTVTDGSTTLVNGTDYTVSYENNTNAGTATVKITGKGNYTGTASKNFTISPKTITDSMLSAVSEKTYTGAAIEQAITVTDGSTTLVNDTDYTVSYSDNVNAGTATVKVTGKGNYTGEISKTFTIKPIIIDATAAAAETRQYDGTNKVTITGVTLDGVVGGDNVSVNTENLTGTVESANVGEYTKVTLQNMTLTGDKSDNYTLHQPNITLDTSVKIEKADVPEITKGTQLNIANNLEKEYSYLLSRLCPQINTDGASVQKDWGAREYEIVSVVLQDGYYIADTARIDKAENPSVSGGNVNNTLYLPIKFKDIADEGVVGTVKIKIKSANYNDFENSFDVVTHNKDAVTFSITPENSVYSGNSWRGYTGEPTITDTSGNSVTLTPEIRWSARVGTGYNEKTEPPTNAGTYSVIFRVADTDEKYIGKNTFNFEITKAQGSGSVTMDGWTYGQTASVPVPQSETNGIEGVSYMYKIQGADDSEYKTEKPKNVGNYTVKATFAEVTNYNAVVATADFEISKATPTVTAPTAKDLTYTGEAQELITAGGTADGEIQYSLSENDGYSTDIPTGTDAKEYTVWYKVIGDSNYNNAEPQSITVTIKKATPTVTAPTAKDLTYTGEAQELIEAGSTTGGEMQYSLSENEGYSTAIPTAIHAGTYTVYYKVVGNDNYNDAAAASIEVTVHHAEQTPPTVNIDYANETLSTNTTMEYSLNNADWVSCTDNMEIVKFGYDGASLDVYIREAETADKDASAAVKITLPARISAPNVKGGSGIITRTTDAMEYRPQGGEWTAVTDTIITDLEAGVYEVRYKATDKAFASTAASVEVKDKSADTILEPGESVTKGDVTVTNNEDGTVTIDKGNDGTPDTTITMPESGDVTVDKDGNTTVPNGSTVQTGDNEEITLPNGGTVDKDGNVTGEKVVIGDTTITAPTGETVKTDKDGNTTVPNGSTVQTGDGAEITLPNGGTVDKDGNVTGEKVVVGDTTITAPTDETVKTDKDGNTTVPNGSTVQTGDGAEITLPNGGTVDKDGNVTGEKVVVGDTTITAPTGETVKTDKDGNTTVPNGSTVQTGDGAEITLPNGGTVDKDGNVTGEKVVVGDTTITAPTGETVKTDKDGNTTVPNGSTVQIGDGAEITLPNGGTVDKDGNVTGEKVVVGDTTITAPTGETVKTDKDGNTTVPIGTTIEKDGTKITVVEGDNVTVDKDGNISFPSGGKADIDKDGKTYTVEVTTDGKIDFGNLPTPPKKPHRGGGSSIKATPKPTETPITEPTETDKPTPTDKPSDNWFTDVPENAWYYNSVKYVFENGLMLGVSDTEFKPLDNITRGMFVTVLYRMEGEPEINSQSAFADIDGAYYTNAVKWANENKIVEGYTDEIFAPEDNITREQMAAIVCRYAKFKQYDTDIGSGLSYSDNADISDYAKDAVIWSSEHGIMLGNEDNTFAPMQNTNRAQSAAVFERIVKNLH